MQIGEVGGNSRPSSESAAGVAGLDGHTGVTVAFGVFDLVVSVGLG